jgi:hypothetical protein
MLDHSVFQIVIDMAGPFGADELLDAHASRSLWYVLYVCVCVCVCVYILYVYNFWR